MTEASSMNIEELLFQERLANLTIEARAFLHASGRYTDTYLLEILEDIIEFDSDLNDEDVLAELYEELREQSEYDEEFERENY